MRLPNCFFFCYYNTVFYDLWVESEQFHKSWKMCFSEKRKYFDWKDRETHNIILSEEFWSECYHFNACHHLVQKQQSLWDDRRRMLIWSLIVTFHTSVQHSDWSAQAHMIEYWALIGQSVTRWLQLTFCVGVEFVWKYFLLFDMWHEWSWVCAQLWSGEHSNIVTCSSCYSLVK